MTKNCQKLYPLDTLESNLKTMHIFAKKLS